MRWAPRCSNTSGINSGISYGYADINAHNPRTPMCLRLTDSASCVSNGPPASTGPPSIELEPDALRSGTTASWAHVVADPAADTTRRVLFFSTFVRHFRLNSSSSLSVAGKNEQCNKPPRTCAVLTRTSSTESSSRRKTMFWTCCTHSSLLNTMGMLLNTITWSTSMTASRADHDDIRETSSIVCRATGMHSGKVSA